MSEKHERRREIMNHVCEGPDVGVLPDDPNDLLPRGSRMDVRRLPGSPECPSGVTVMVDCAGWGDGLFFKVVGRHGAATFWVPDRREDEEDSDEGEEEDDGP